MNTDNSNDSARCHYSTASAAKGNRRTARRIGAIDATVANSGSPTQQRYLGYVFSSVKRFVAAVEACFRNHRDAPAARYLLQRFAESEVTVVG